MSLELLIDTPDVEKFSDVFEPMVQFWFLPWTWGEGRGGGGGMCAARGVTDDFERENGTGGGGGGRGMPSRFVAGVDVIEGPDKGH